MYGVALNHRRVTLWVHIPFGTHLNVACYMPIRSRSSVSSSVHRLLARCRRHCSKYRGADKSLARPGRKQATATEDFDVHVSYL